MRICICLMIIGNCLFAQGQTKDSVNTLKNKPETLSQSIHSLSLVKNNEKIMENRAVMNLQNLNILHPKANTLFHFGYNGSRNFIYRDDFTKRIYFLSANRKFVSIASGN